MKSISVESTPTVKILSFKFALALFGQWFGAFIVFIVAMIIADIASPSPQFIREKRPEAGFMPDSSAMLFNGAINATILIWAAFQPERFCTGGRVVRFHVYRADLSNTNRDRVFPACLPAPAWQL